MKPAITRRCNINSVFLEIRFSTVRFITLAIVASGILIAISCSAASYNTGTIPFVGNSSGGTLTLMKAPLVNYPYIEVTNHAGEGANVVIRRVVDALDHSKECKDYYGTKLVVDSTETSLQLSGGSNAGLGAWIIGGSERGFNVPDAPKSVSAQVRAREIVVNWINPDSIYDSITVVTEGYSWRGLPGNQTHFEYPLEALNPLMNITSFCFIVVGTKRGMPSNGSGVWVRKRVEQQSLMNAPFTKGLAPNFSAWSSKRPDGGSVVMEEGLLNGVGPGQSVRGLKRNGFYQVIKGVGQFDGGVWRQFLGLTPGNTYRVSTRMNTMQMEDGDWGFSLNATHDFPHGDGLTSQQMAGVEVLPDNSKGPDAGMVARYDSNLRTSGKWVTISSGAKTAERPGSDVTLPAGITSLTVWFRFEGSSSNETAVAFDSLSIEDLGAKESSPK